MGLSTAEPGDHAYAQRTVPEEPLPEVSDFSAVPGRGVRGRVDGRLVEVLAPDDALPAALIEVGDVVRPDSYRAVDRLRRLGVRPVLATGIGKHRRRQRRRPWASMRRTPAARPRTRPTWYGTCRNRAVGSRSSATARTTPALAGADLGIAMGSGTDVAIGASEVTPARGDIEALADAVRLARRALGTIRTKLVWAFRFNPGRPAALPVLRA